MVASSVSPERCDITAAKPASCAMRTASSVSLKVPIWLTLTRMALAIPLVDAALQARDIGDEEIVADELHLIADRLGQRLPAFPIVFGHAVLDGIDRIVADEVRIGGDQLGALQRASLAL